MEGEPIMNQKEIRWRQRFQNFKKIFGLPEKHMIVKVLDEMKEIEKADIFGSRAMGNYKKGSDVDLAIYGEEVTLDIVNKISIRLNGELPVPYYFDVVHYEDSFL